MGDIFPRRPACSSIKMHTIPSGRERKPQALSKARSNAGTPALSPPGRPAGHRYRLRGNAAASPGPAAHGDGGATCRPPWAPAAPPPSPPPLAPLPGLPPSVRGLRPPLLALIALLPRPRPPEGSSRVSPAGCEGGRAVLAGAAREMAACGPRGVRGEGSSKGLARPFSDFPPPTSSCFSQK